MRPTRHDSILIVTDIDGTLLDHNGRLPCSAHEWRCAVRPYSVAFASSRTLDELMVLQRALGVVGPCIAEDSAVLALDAAHGGRWLTLADTSEKGAVSRFLVAIGNEENDVSLLQKADLAFVIRNPGSGPHPALTAIPHAVVLNAEGPGGWLEMLNGLQDFTK